MSPSIYSTFMPLSGMKSYFTPSHTQQFELEIKRSRFISVVGHASSRESAKVFINELRLRYPDANHHCWAFITGKPGDIHGLDQSDDGEPKDTAGKPILNVLQHSGLGHIVLVVVRYFGGVKLGAGGLVRAYSQSASNAIKQLETREHVIYEQVTISLPYSLLGKVEYWLQNESIELLDKQFDNHVQLNIAVPLIGMANLQEELNVLGNGEITMINH